VEMSALKAIVGPIAYRLVNSNEILMLLLKHIPNLQSNSDI
jgi:hypothetical protein